MYDTLLFLHFFGLSIGAGTGFYMLALARHASHNLEQAEARTLMPGISATVSSVGTVGLVILIASGLAMGAMLGQAILSAMFLTKMVLVITMVVFVIVMKLLAKRVRSRADKTAMQLMRRLGLLGPLLGGVTILFAVLTFH